MPLKLTIDTRTDRQLQQLVQTLAVLNTDINRNVRQQSRAVIVPELQKGLAERANTRLQHKMLVSSATVQITDRNVHLRSGTKGGLPGFKAGVNQNAQRVEFGGNPQKVTTYTRKNKKGGSHKVTRRTARQLGPRYRNGATVFPAAEDLIPRIRKLWIQTAVREVHEQIEEVLKNGR